MGTTAGTRVLCTQYLLRVASGGQVLVELTLTLIKNLGHPQGFVIMPSGVNLEDLVIAFRR